MASRSILGLHILMPIFSGLTYRDSPSKMNRIKYTSLRGSSLGLKAQYALLIPPVFHTNSSSNSKLLGKQHLKSISIPAIREGFMCEMDIKRLHAQIVFKVQLLQSYF